jgi:hypothetical protein
VPQWEGVVREHLDDVKQRAEQRASLHTRKANRKAAHPGPN